MTDNNQLTDEQVNAATKELIVKFPKIERLPVDPPVAGQNYGGLVRPLQFSIFPFHTALEKKNCLVICSIFS